MTRKELLGIRDVVNSLVLLIRETSTKNRLEVYDMIREDYGEDIYYSVRSKVIHEKGMELRDYANFVNTRY